MTILLVTGVVIGVAWIVLRARLARDPIFESLADAQRREWRAGWDGPTWRFPKERP